MSQDLNGQYQTALQSSTAESIVVRRHPSRSRNRHQHQLFSRRITLNATSRDTSDFARKQPSTPALSDLHDRAAAMVAHQQYLHRECWSAVARPEIKRSTPSADISLSSDIQQLNAAAKTSRWSAQRQRCGFVSPDHRRRKRIGGELKQRPA